MPDVFRRILNRLHEEQSKVRPELVKFYNSAIGATKQARTHMSALHAAEQEVGKHLNKLVGVGLATQLVVEDLKRKLPDVERRRAERVVWQERTFSSATSDADEIRRLCDPSAENESDRAMLECYKADIGSFESIRMVNEIYRNIGTILRDSLYGSILPREDEGPNAVALHVLKTLALNGLGTALGTIPLAGAFLAPLPDIRNAAQGLVNNPQLSALSSATDRLNDVERFANVLGQWNVSATKQVAALQLQVPAYADSVETLLAVQEAVKVMQKKFAQALSDC